jgi:hypothetical protein
LNNVLLNRHRDALADASADHVPDATAPQIVKQFSGNSGSLAGGFPGFAEIAHRSTVEMENVGRDGGIAVFGLIGPSRPPAFDDLGEFVLENDFVRAAVLDVFGSCHDHARSAVHIGPGQ